MVNNMETEDIEDTMWLVDYEFFGGCNQQGHKAAVAICNSMEMHQVFTLTDGVIATALRSLDSSWDKNSLLKVVENCSFSQSESVPL